MATVSLSESPPVNTTSPGAQPRSSVTEPGTGDRLVGVVAVDVAAGRVAEMLGQERPGVHDSGAHRGGRVVVEVDRTLAQPLRNSHANPSFVAGAWISYMRTATTSPDAAVIAAIAQTAARSPNRSATTPASVRAAVAEIDSDGNATLVFAPGRYTIGKRGRLTAAIVQGLPVDPIADLGDTLGDEVTAWLAEQDQGQSGVGRDPRPGR
jgi:hypothetical protein